MYKMSLTNAHVGCYKSQQAQCVLRIGFLLTIQFLDKLRWHLTENIYLQFESVIMVQFNPLDLQLLLQSWCSSLSLSLSLRLFLNFYFWSHLFQCLVTLYIIPYIFKYIHRYKEERSRRIETFGDGSLRKVYI